MDLLFKRIAPGADALWFGTIAQYGSDHPEAFVNEMNEWQGALSAEVNSYDFFEAKGERYRGIMLGVAGLAVLGGFAWAWFSGNFIPLHCCRSHRRCLGRHKHRDVSAQQTRS